MTKTELLAEIENFKQKDNLPYLNNKEYKRLFLRYCSKEKEEFLKTIDNIKIKENK